MSILSSSSFDNNKIYLYSNNIFRLENLSKNIIKKLLKVNSSKDNSFIIDATNDSTQQSSNILEKIYLCK